MLGSFIIPIFAELIYNVYLMNIKKVIKDKGWTLEQLAAEMSNKRGGKGVSQASVSQLLSGNPTLDKLQEIATIIGVSVSDLLADEPAHRTRITCPHCHESFDVEVEVIRNN